MDLRDVRLRGDFQRHMLCTILDDGMVRLVIGPGPAPNDGQQWTNEDVQVQIFANARIDMSPGEFLRWLDNTKEWLERNIRTRISGT